MTPTQKTAKQDHRNPVLTGQSQNFGAIMLLGRRSPSEAVASPVVKGLGDSVGARNGLGLWSGALEGGFANLGLLTQL